MERQRLVYPVDILLSASSACLVALLFVQAARERNDGAFWDDNNPQGFHRFVPPTYAALAALAINGFFWSTTDIWLRLA